MNTHKKERGVLLCLTALALAIRLFLIFKRAPAADEIWFMFLTQASFKDIWLGTYAEMIAPFYFLLLRAFSLILNLSFSILSLRLIVLFWGILASVTTGYLAYLVFGKKEGMIALFLSLFLPASVWAAIFARYYSFLIFLSGLAMIFFIRYLKTQKTTNVFFLVLISAIGTYTHHYFWLLFLSFGVFVVLTKKSRQLVLGWIYGLVGLFILMAPGLFYFWTLPKPQIWRSANSLLKIPGALLTNVFSFEVLLFFYQQASLMIFLAFAIYLLILIYLLKRGLESWKDDLWALFLLMIFFPPVAALVVSYLFRPVFGLNSLLIFLPAFVVVLTWGINSVLREKKVLTAPLLFLLFLSLSSFFLSSFREPTWVKPYLFVETQLEESDLVLHADIYTFIQAKYYLKKDVNFGVIPTIYLPQTEKALGYREKSREDALQHQGRVWYFEPVYFNVKGAKDFNAFLDDNFVLEKKKEFRESLTNVYLYSGVAR